MKKIIVDPGILGGKPILEGTRISVELILNLLASDASEEEILEDYAHLTKADIQACLNYAARCRKNEIYLELSQGI
ncbi:antitoxin [Candidatus Poribacteria bacterium]|nr:MAG: antitoxin [Candidatus Poribacteria bacterium]